MRFFRALLATVLCSALLLAGCSADSADRAAEPIRDGVGLQSAESAAEAIVSPEREVDVDLTALSGVMVYAEVYAMMIAPEDYIGKTIRIRGPYSPFFFDDTGLTYHYVLIEDATACCQQGIEFALGGKPLSPREYPAESMIIEVTGVFELYEELGETYCRLASGEMSVLG